jgi:hypothetical protein
MDSITWTIAGASITFFVAALNWASSPAEKWDKRLYQHAVLFAAVFTVYGSWRAFLVSEENKWRQEDVQFQSEWQQRQQLKERLRYERQLRAKADEIASLNQKIAGFVTGGDSYVFLAFSLFPKTNDSLLSLLHHGEFPVFDVSIEMYDSDEQEKQLGQFGSSIPLKEGLEIMKPIRTFNFPTVRPNMAVSLVEPWNLPVDKDAVRYRFIMFTRNGIMAQFIRLQRVNGSWTQASRVTRSTSPKKKSVVLYQWADPEFPRNQKGKIVW